MNTKLVLKLSFQSNTPEAATLKSLIYNGSVGLIKNQYGFANDIDHMAYLQLSGDKNIDAKKIDNFLKKKKYIQSRIYSKIYLEKYFEKAQKSMHKFFKINSFKYQINHGFLIQMIKLQILFFYQSDAKYLTI